MKFLQKMKQKKADNKGFSLVELIIVIAIMAILVGIVGTQVIPYINKSREARDFQIISSYSTAGMTAYAANADSVDTVDASGAPLTIVVDMYTGTPAAGSDEALLQEEVELLTDNNVPDFESELYDGAADIRITFNFNTNEITAQAVDASGAGIGEAVVSEM